MKYISKREEILKLVRGRKVLHLGCVGFTDCPPTDRIRRARESLHFELTQMARVTGIDNSSEVINELRAGKIFDNIVYGNVEELQQVPLTDTFDLIVAGDIIEHLSNPGRMLDGLLRFCHPETQLVITTPNAFGFFNFMRHLAGCFHEGAEHILMFNSSNLIQMLDRHGYFVEQMDSCHQPLASNRRIRFYLGRLLLRVFPHVGGTLFCVARVKGVRAAA